MFFPRLCHPRIMHKHNIWEPAKKIIFTSVKMPLLTEGAFSRARMTMVERKMQMTLEGFNTTLQLQITCYVMNLFARSFFPLKSQLPLGKRDLDT